MRSTYCLLLSLSLITLCGCDWGSKKSKSGTYLGGEIVNPLSNTITISKGNKTIATIKLDQNNKFLYKFKKFTPGLYSFNHNEYQLAYLEEGDSVMLRVNTLEFDETLSFSGYGASENNFITKMYLQNEHENELMLTQQIYQRAPIEFEKAIDSLKEERLVLWNKFKENHQVSSTYEDIIDAIIKYDFYARKEVYPLSYYGSNIDQMLNQLPENFYEYREGCDFDKYKYLELFGYKRFLWSHFNQMAYLQYNEEQEYDINSFTHNLHKLRLIDNEVKDDSVSSYLLTRTIRDYLANSNDKTGGDVLYDLYMKKVTSRYDKQRIKYLYTANKNIETGKAIPNEKLISITGDTTALRDLIRKPTFIFFWSKNTKNHFKRAHQLAQNFITRFPEYDYLAINIDEDKEQWQKIVSRYGYIKSKEFQFKDAYEEIKDDLAITAIFKTFIIDRDGTILNGHANMFSTHFEEELLAYLNQ